MTTEPTIPAAIVEKAAEAKYRRAYPDVATHPWKDALEADYCRAAVTRAIAPVYADIQAEALREAANSLAQSKHVWHDAMFSAVTKWLYRRADELDGGKP